MKRSPRPRKTVELSKSLHQRLNTYALAAGAAGVTALALAQPANARIIYTKVNIPIVGSYNLDVNHDGVVDFVLYNVYSFTTYHVNSGVSAWVAVHGTNQGHSSSIWNGPVVSHNSQNGFALKLPPNAPVSKKRVFGSSLPWHQMADCYFSRSAGSHSRGPWRHALSRYLGLMFSISGQRHYGWARLNVQLNKECRFDVTLTGYAYETIPNKLILTGHTKGPDATAQPATLGDLAVGRR